MQRGAAFYILAVLFAIYVLFLYGPTLTILVLSFQGPDGGLTFPMNGVSLHWFANLFEQQAVGDLGGALRRSLALAAMVTVATVVLSVAAGMGFRRRFIGSAFVFYLAIASLIVPSILVSLGIGLFFNQLGWDPNWYTSGFGAQLTWTLPFGLLIMFAIFNRFNPAWEEAARDQGATPWRHRHRAVRLHALVRRVRAHAADRRQRQHAAAGNLRHDDEHHHARAVRPRHRHHRAVLPGDRRLAGRDGAAGPQAGAPRRIKPVVRGNRVTVPPKRRNAANVSSDQPGPDGCHSRRHAANRHLPARHRHHGC
jgi:ABC-type spermidine/putrescine transport system permease subunit II